MGLRARRLRIWYAIHKWTSLVCTVFLLLICLTGLPLVFSDEIDHWLDQGLPYASLPADAPRASLDALAAEALRRHPGEIVTSIFVDDHEPQVLVFMSPSWKSFEDEPQSNHEVKFDAHTGGVLRASDPPDRRHMSVMEFVRHLHTDLFVELPGELFLGFMGLLFVTAIVSGIVLYGAFMKKLPFGTVRDERAKRLKWLDLHNLLGIVVLAWMVVVGCTGVVNELSTPLFTLWQKTEVQDTVKPWQGRVLPAPSEWSSPDAAFDTVKKALPGMNVISIVYPGSPFGTPNHYMVWAKGRTPLTSRLFSPALVDARTGELTSLVQMPWYLRALELCRPLHFGDYGGLPLKILWTLMDVITIVVLGSGLYLWVARRGAEGARLEKLVQASGESSRS